MFKNVPLTCINTFKAKSGRVPLTGGVNLMLKRSDKRKEELKLWQKLF